MNKFFKNPYWSFIGVVFTIFLYFFPHQGGETLNEQYSAWIFESLKWSFITGTFIFALYAYINTKKKEADKVLRDIAKSHRSAEVSEWGIGKYDYNSAIQSHDTWQQWMLQIIQATGRHDIEPHNLGDFYYLYDLSSGEKIEFPKNKINRESKIGNRFSTGRIIRVVPKK